MKSLWWVGAIALPLVFVVGCGGDDSPGPLPVKTDQKAAQPDETQVNGAPASPPAEDITTPPNDRGGPTPQPVHRVRQTGE